MFKNICFGLTGCQFNGQKFAFCSVPAAIMLHKGVMHVRDLTQISLNATIFLNCIGLGNFDIANNMFCGS